MSNLDEMVSELHAENDIQGDFGVNAIIGKKTLTKDKEKALAEDDVDKTKAGAEEIDEEAGEDTEFSLKSRANARHQRAVAANGGDEHSAAGGLSGEQLEAMLATKSLPAVFDELSVMWDDVNAEADQTFILDGDALLAQICSSNLLSWSDSKLKIGGQYLHVIYSFERCINSLLAGGRQVRLMWFDCIGASLTNKRSDLACLRELVQLHARYNCKLLQDRFASWRESSFKQYLERVDPAFIIIGDAHTGAYSSTSNHSISLSGSSLQFGEPCELFRTLTLDLLAHNFRCIRLSEMLTSATSIHAFRYSMAIEYQHLLRQPNSINESVSLPTYNYEADIIASEADHSTVAAVNEIQSQLQSILPSSSVHSLARLSVVCHALARSLQSKNHASAKDAMELSKVILIHSFFQSTLSLKDRSWSDAHHNSPFKHESYSVSFLQTFFDESLHALVMLKNETNSSFTEQARESFADYFDLRLLALIFQKLHAGSFKNLGLTRAQAQQLESTWKVISGRIGNKQSTFLPLFSLAQLAPDVDVESAEAQAEREAAEAEKIAVAKVAVVTQASASKPAAVAVAAKPVVEKESWDDEDEDDAADEAVDDWENLADEEEAPQAAASVAETAPVAQSAVSTPEALVPVVQVIDNTLLNSLCGDANAALTEAGALVNTAEPALPAGSSIFTNAYEAALHSVEIVKEGDITKDRKAMRHHQRQITFMNNYSKSLGGGKIIQREVIVRDTKPVEETKAKHATTSKAAKGGKKAQVSQRDLIQANTAAALRAKEAEKLQRVINYAGTMKTLQAKINSLDSATEDYSDDLVLPALFQLLEWQIQLWREVRPVKGYIEAVKAWTSVHDIFRRFKNHLSGTDMQTLGRVLTALGFADTAAQLAQEYATFKSINVEDVRVTARDATKAYGDISVGMSANRFQLEHGGPFMLRNMSSTKDPRVDFYPDAWQQKLLDVVDARHSALLVAPTSSGKTFISYYAMKQTLKENASVQRSKQRGVIIYVAPNKALVNQVSGDIYRRFGDVFGVLTSDWQYRVLTCDVLITVPASLEALLLDPFKAEWAQQIRYVIFDEVHMIGSEEGLIWERCIHIAQHAPFLALSATVGNASAFHSWLAKCQAFHRRPVHLIVHETRWADLEKSMYLPQPANPLMEQSKVQQFSVVDLHRHAESMRADASLQSIVPIHPAAAIHGVSDLQERQAFPAELAFSPNDSLSMYDSMKGASSRSTEKLNDELSKAFAALNPDVYFQGLSITKADAMEYERALKSALTDWLRAGYSSLVNEIVSSLSASLRDRLAQFNKMFQSPDDSVSVAFQLQHFLPLLTELAANDHLPAIVFCHDQLLCNQLVETVVTQLEQLQEDRRKAETTEESERARAREREKAVKAARRLRDKQKNRAAEEELAREGFSSATVEDRDDDLWYEVDPRFSFIKPGEQMDNTEMEWWIQRMLWKTGWKKTHPLVRCLYRGIGVHHGAMVKPYRDAVETLFRAKHLKVVVATQTLALGINMPAKSVVFCGDSKLLTPLQYRQMAGRAGRRGYDNVGHICFFALPTRKILRLLKSPLLSLRGAYPVTASYPLRQLAYAEGLPQDNQLALQLFQSSVRAPFFAHSQAGQHVSSQIEFHYRYCAEFLFQRMCLSHSGSERGIAGFIAHLHSAEPSNFILAELLLNGYLARLTNNARNTTEKNTAARKLLQVLAHLFNRVPLPLYTASMSSAAAATDLDAGSHMQQSLLPPLENEVNEIISAYNRSTLEWATNFVRTFATLELNGKVRETSQARLQQADDIKSAVDATNPTAAAEPVKEKGAKGKREKPTKAAAESKESETVVSTLEFPEIPDINTKPAVDTSLPVVFDALNALPRSGILFPVAFNAPAESLISAIQSSRDMTDAKVSPVRSPFVSLSGRAFDADFSSGREFIETVRNGVYLDSTSLPVLEWLDASFQSLPLNSYIVDFYRHGSLELLIEDNGLQRSRVFELLKRWDLFLIQLRRAVECIAKNKDSALVRVFQHLQTEYHATFAKVALQH